MIGVCIRETGMYKFMHDMKLRPRGYSTLGRFYDEVNSIDDVIYRVKRFQKIHPTWKKSEGFPTCLIAYEETDDPNVLAVYIIKFKYV